MAKLKMIISTLLLLLLCITATPSTSGSTTHKRSRYHRQWVGNNSSIKMQHITRYGESAATKTTTRPRTANKEHGLWRAGFVPYPVVPGIMSTYQTWEGSSMNVKYCPSSCQCAQGKTKQGYKGLLVTNCTSDPIEELPKLFNAYNDTQYLELDLCLLSSLPQDIVKLNSLFVLILLRNQFTEFPNQLQQLPLLQVLVIAGNKAGYINLENMTQLLRLRTLCLSYNRISALPRGMGHMRTLSHLDVSSNFLQEVPFLPLEYLDSLALGYNRISTVSFRQICILRTGSLQSVDLRNNGITYIEPMRFDMSQCFSSGAVINLANNKISTLDQWPLLMAQKIRMVFNLTGNMLSKFTNYGGSFAPTFQFGTLFILQQNQIRYFMDVFNGWKIDVRSSQNLNGMLTDTYVDLGGNPMVCDCVDYRVYRYIQTFRTDQYNNLVCHEPLSLRGQNPGYIPLWIFACQVDVNCPIGCTCLQVPHSKTINVTCGNYTQTDIPEIVPDLVPGEKYNGYRIDIVDQNLHEISFRPYLQQAVEIRLSKNAISFINITSPKVLQRIKILHLDDNRLQRLPLKVIPMVNMSVRGLRLGGNPWVCDCESIALKNWLTMNWYILKDKENVLCHSPPHMVGVKVIDIDRSMVCDYEKDKTAVYVFLIISIFTVVIILYVSIVGILEYAQWKALEIDECEGEGKEFDIFLCASSKDSQYVENFLIPELRRRNYRVLYHVEHFDPTKYLHINMSEALHKSKRTVAFFSNRFRLSRYSMFEFRSALHQDIRNKRRRLITIKDTDLDMSKLEGSEVEYFHNYMHIKREDVKFWKLMEYLLARKRLGGQAIH